MAKITLKTGNIIKQTTSYHPPRRDENGNLLIDVKHFLLLQPTNECPECRWLETMGKKVKHTKGWVAVYLEEGQTLTLCADELKDHKKSDGLDNLYYYYLHEQVG